MGKHLPVASQPINIDTVTRPESHEAEKETLGDPRFCASDLLPVSKKAHADTHHLQFRLSSKQHDNNVAVLHK